MFERKREYIGEYNALVKKHMSGIAKRREYFPFDVRKRGEFLLEIGSFFSHPHHSAKFKTNSAPTHR